MLEKLPELMKKDFPELKDATYELRTVHPSMKKFLSPAFYLTPPVDTRNPNVIYINDSGRTSSLELFGTLAQKDFPVTFIRQFLLPKTIPLTSDIWSPPPATWKAGQPTWNHTAMNMPPPL